LIYYTSARNHLRLTALMDNNDKNHII